MYQYINNIPQDIKDLNLVTSTTTQSSVSIKTFIPDHTFFVALTGSPTGDGTINNPFATLDQARDHMRHLKQQPNFSGSIAILLRGGTYHMSTSFVLEEQDTHDASHPLMISNYNDEYVEIIGGYKLDKDTFAPIQDAYKKNLLCSSAREHVLEYDLSYINFDNYQGINLEGFNWPKVPASPELIIGNTSMITSRYPNEGFLNVSDVIEVGFIPRTNEDTSIPKQDYRKQKGPIIQCSDLSEERLSKWANEKPYFFGYWFWDWAHDTLTASSINPTDHTITFSTPSYYGARPQSRYYAFNLFCEIDMPSEWFLDSENKKLYLYPPSEGLSEDIYLTFLDQPLFHFKQTENVAIQNIHFKASRGVGVYFEDCHDCEIAQCEFSLLGDKAVRVGDENQAFNGTILLDSESKGGRRNGVVNCYIHDIGAGGISLVGGNRTTLEPACHYAINNHICNFSRLVKTYSPAIGLTGVGHLAQHNEIHNAPHMAIQFAGNNHDISLNDIYDVTNETSDVGVIYSARDWTYRGNKITQNYIHDIPSMHGEGSYSIYLDDMMSSATIENNIFQNLEHFAFLLGGGRDSIIRNNLMINCAGTIRIDARATHWAAKTAEAPNGDAYVALQNVPYKEGIWASTYPELVNLWDDEPKYSKGHIVQHNISYASGNMILDPIVEKYGQIAQNITVSSKDGSMDSTEAISCFNAINIGAIGRIPTNN